MREEMKRYIEEHWRPRIQADGGEMRFVSLEGNTVTVRMQGECSRCPIARSCLADFLVKDLRQKFGEAVTLKQTIQRPYFWDA
jgi:Fe-S cluster biogenesis protein NfuA